MTIPYPIKEIGRLYRDDDGEFTVFQDIEDYKPTNKKDKK